MDVTIPDIGDAQDVEVIEICVAPGDAVAENDALIVIESDKASMEVPAPSAGTVDAVLVSLGDLVNAGDPILRMDAVEAEPPAEAVAPPDTADGSAAPPDAAPVAAAATPSTARERIEIRVPDIGEAEDVSVIEVAVAEGQRVGVDDLLVVVESEKASMEIPTPFAGTVLEVAVKEGDGVEESTLLVVLEGEVDAPPPPTVAEPEQAASGWAEPG